MRKLTQAEFLQRSIQKHGDKYDYSLAEYKGLKEFVTIICKTHGEFQQRAGEHFRYGCNQCGNERTRDSKRLDTETVIRRSREINGDRYDYSRTTYVDSETKITIGCKIHGFFEQLPGVHYLRGSGCNECGNDSMKLKQRETKEEFVQKAKQVHGDVLDYSKVNYQGSHVKVEIICPIHGSFFQTPAAHKSGAYCRHCSFELNAQGTRIGIEEFIRRAKKIHGEKFDYSQSVYKSKDTPLVISCPTHGEFNQSPANHIRLEQGCPSCATTGFDPSQSGFYYVNVIFNEDGDVLYYKGGISGDWEKRLDRLQFGLPDGLFIENEGIIFFQNGHEARNVETEVLRLGKKIGVYAPPRNFDGGHELFLENPLEFAKHLFPN